MQWRAATKDSKLSNPDRSHPDQVARGPANSPRTEKKEENGVRSHRKKKQEENEVRSRTEKKKEKNMVPK